MLGLLVKWCSVLFVFGEISMDILLGLSHSHCVKFRLQQIPLLFSSGLSGSWSAYVWVDLFMWCVLFPQEEFCYPVECLALTVEEVMHIRQVLVKAELEKFQQYKDIYTALKKGKVNATSRVFIVRVLIFLSHHLNATDSTLFTSLTLWFPL